MSDSLITFARRFRYLRETTPNHGLRVEAIQHWSGGQTADSWCLEFVWFVLDIFTSGQCPFPREQSVETFRVLAVANDWLVLEPLPGDLAISVNAEGRGHHIGIVTLTDPLTSIAGNTSADGSSSNGDGCYEHAISRDGKVFVRVPLPT